MSPPELCEALREAAQHAERSARLMRRAANRLERARDDSEEKTLRAAAPDPPPRPLPLLPGEPSSETLDLARRFHEAILPARNHARDLLAALLAPHDLEERCAIDKLAVAVVRAFNHGGPLEAITAMLDEMKLCWKWDQFETHPKVQAVVDRMVARARGREREEGAA